MQVSLLSSIPTNSISNNVPQSISDIDLNTIFQEYAYRSAKAEGIQAFKYGAVFLGFSVILTVCVDKFVEWKNRPEQAI